MTTALTTTMGGLDALTSPPVRTVSTGVDGLDEVLAGGLPAHRSYLLRGGPGTGKTTLALRFLAAGSAAGEATLYVTLGAPVHDVRADAARVGLSLADVAVLDLSPSSALSSNDDIAELLAGEHGHHPTIAQAILTAAEAQGPSRVVIDSMTQLRDRSEDADEFRRHTLALTQALTRGPATLLFTSEHSDREPDDDLQFLADGVLELGTTPGGSHRVAVTKLRGSGFHGGRHTLRIDDGGVHVYPRLTPNEHKQAFVGQQLPFGVPELDEMLHGGLERGTTTVLTGPSGVGKSTIAAQFMRESAGSGEQAVVFLLDESIPTFVHRCESLGMPISKLVDHGRLSLESVEPLARTPDEIAYMLRTAVEVEGATTVLLDSISAYRLSLSTTDDLGVHLHAIGQYLKNMGATGLLIDETPGVTGDFQVSQERISYLADTAIFLRYLEVDGQLRKAIGILKKRTGPFENALRELSFTPYGIKVGPPLHYLRGILSGLPTWSTPPDG